MKNKNHLLAAVSLISIILLCGRVTFTENFGGIFLTWNLFLAWVPFGIACIVEDLAQHRFIHQRGVLLGAAAWLLFFPNAPYLITDLIHLRASPDHLIWYDALMSFSFALAGLLTGFYSVLKIHALLEDYYSRITSWLLIGGSLVVASYGIYLGRFGRWNSWHVATHPLSLVRYIGNNLLHNPVALQLTLAFSFVMLSTYGAFWVLARSKAE
ncbi:MULTISPECIES: DUF1361 domain-containing protein [Runella]|uniref:Putative membrane protein n=1 Tax=Runella defluvii TaxID=370973 RepID=A0A7W5ZN70_9BACT|nr:MULTISPECIES: DUF1361 domain-containing protein [Runella]MBB3838886.1 putative membrane protein [Runella defluvii]